MNSPTPESIIYFPTPADVLCGRGKACFKHAGNENFRQLIAEHADTYRMADTKKAKMQVVLLVAEIVVARGGRFLVSQDGHWIDGGRKQGKKKTGHAFRDALRGRVKCISKIWAAKGKSNLLETLVTKDNSTSMAQVSDDSSASNCSNSEEDFDLGFDSNDVRLEYEEPVPITSMYDDIQPARDWRRGSLDKNTAKELLDFFMVDCYGHSIFPAAPAVVASAVVNYY